MAELLGPATLAYLEPRDFHPVPSAEVQQIEAADPALLQLLAAVSSVDASEVSFERIDSPAFVIRLGDRVVSVAGYQTWIGSAAHLEVLTREDVRGTGLGRAVASAAVRHALDQGLLAQWRARPPASRRVAQVLGFQELGSQLSFRLR